MVIGTFTSWSGAPVGAPVEAEARPRPKVQVPAQSVEASPEIVYAMRPAFKDAMIVTVVSSEICMRKTIRPNGQTHLELDRGSDSVAISTADLVATVTIAERTERADFESAYEDDLARCRSALDQSTAVRAFRSLTNAVDETESDTAERMSVRLAGALVSHLDGDPGAVRRLSRELHAKYSLSGPRGRRRVTDDWGLYKRSVVRSCAELHMALAGLSCWNLTRHIWIIKWLTQVEAAWHSYAFGSTAWRTRR